MGETQNQPFQLSFNASLKADFQGSRVTSDGDLILVRELDERRGGESGASCRRVVPESGLHRNQPDSPQPGGGALALPLRNSR